SDTSDYELYTLSLHDALPILSEKSLKNYEGKVKLIATVPSVDTGVCSEETHRFNKEAVKLDNVQVLTISMDLPFAQGRWCAAERSEEHTSELQSRFDLVCRLL